MRREGYSIRIRCSIVLLIILYFNSNLLFAQQLAFPGAEGFGRFATGGRGGTVYHVTNLNNNGPGSFRDAVSQSNRIVVFDVAGIINITSRIVVSSNITIAGQTAPGDGVVIYGNGLSFSNANNTIVRYMRFRMGTGGDSGKDAITIAEGSDMIFDHISVTWGRDGTFDINFDSGKEISNITIQNSVIGQGLQTHSTGGLMQSTGGVSLLRNLWIDNNSRNPKVKGINQYVNNVVYNWNVSAYILGDSETDSYANIINNYFIDGPNTSSAAFTRGNLNFHVYASNNYQDSNKDGILNGSVIPQDSYGTVDWQIIPYDYPEVTLLSPEDAYNFIVTEAGASIPARDEVDKRLILELTSLGTTGQLISDENDEPMNGCGTIAKGKVVVDTDQDGMSDEWEYYYGLNPNSTSDQNTDYDEDGYTNIEEYINSTYPGEGSGVLNDGLYVISPSHSEKLLDIARGSTDEGAFLIQQQLQKTGSQEWNVTDIGNEYYSIINKNSGLAMSVENESAEEGARIIQSAFTANESQQWSINFIGNGLYSIINRNSLKSIEVDGGSTDNGAQIYQTSYIDSAYQQFKIYSASLLSLPPEASINLPFAGTIYTKGSDIYIDAYAEDFDGNIEKVEFFASDEKIAEDTIEPFRYIWSNVTEGNYQLSIRATDNEWLSTSSSDVNITVLNTGGYPATIQENKTGFCSVDGSIDNDNAGFSGYGFANTDNASGKGINWKVNFAEDNTYTFSWRFANGSGNRPAKIIVNNEELGSTIDFPGTGEWTVWSVVSTDININAGITDIRLEAIEAEGLANIDYIEISGDNTRPADCSGQGAAGSIMIEYYTGITGSLITDLVTNSNFPGNPSYVNELTSLEAPINIADEFGSRIRGFIHPKISGEYDLWIAGNDECGLWLSKDIYPANAIKIAEVPGWTDIRQWDKYPEQQSNPVVLNAGKQYYIEVIHKEAGGEDNVSVAWSGQGITQEIIDGMYLSPWTDTTNPEGVIHTSVNNSDIVSCNIYPNPVKDMITIKLSEKFNCRVMLQLYSSLGKLLFTENIEGDQYIMDISGLFPGIYILRIFNRNDLFIAKISKQ